MNTKLKTIIEKPTFSFDELFEKDVLIHEFKIDCSKLEKPNYEEKSLGYVKSILPIIHQLMTIEKPCIYWFEANDEQKANTLINNLNNYKIQNTGRKVPAKNKNKNSNCLYVGVRHGGTRKRDNFSFIAGRISIHFGYYHASSTQGLNLAYWANENVTLKVIELPFEASPFLNVLEKELAKKLKPLCGRN